MISIIIPTLGNRPDELNRLFNSLSSQTYQNFEVILVTQINHECIHDLSHDNMKIKHVKLNKKGLSYSRNEGLKYISGSIVTFSDDDCWYPEDSFQNVMNTLEKDASIDVACFQIFDPIQDVYYKNNYDSNPKTQISKRDITRKSSIELFVRLKNVKPEDLRFDENFGLGTKYPSGEENIFLSDLMKKKLKISYIPQIIVYHKKPNIHSRLTETQIISKGPLFKRLTNTPVAFILLILFFLKKAKNIHHPFPTFISSVKEILNYKK
ncbi:glycosyltransferase family 2 protein [Metabacillus sediminilitoris]|uniref:Glycosyltransferase family 2 protein n=1 Tax=Metabacillus sediminilitoris TaxID=2567941 RepID=A0A4S4C6U2_9BACI|nr:glycosyltransferase family 2 protein [Metabacillus sediminilitoris]QGQ48161.1 glycosyltransferase [Metabacillus sediminilitoris]THF81476.1 glycosyltransferase family 2 protein [Metabacillus sediminilitoris]